MAVIWLQDDWKRRTPSDERRVVGAGSDTLSLNSYQPSRHVLVCKIHHYSHQYHYPLTLFLTFKRDTRPKGFQADALLPYTRFHRWYHDLCNPWRRQIK
jgi:hypothetical protein